MAGAAAEVEFVAMCGGSGARGAGLAHAATAEVAAPTCAAAELLAAPAHAGGHRVGRLGQPCGRAPRRQPGARVASREDGRRAAEGRVEREAKKRAGQRGRGGKER